MRITFVLPDLHLGGGNLVVARYASGLAARGHEVTVVAQRSVPPNAATVLKTLLRERRLPSKPTSIVDRLANVDVRLTSATEIEQGDVLPAADILVATWWRTVEWISSAGPEKGKQLHLVQGHEVFDYLPRDRTRAVLRKSLPKVVVSKWLEGLMRDEYRAADVHLVENAVDLSEFRTVARAKNAVPTFGFVYSKSELKNSGLAVDALRVIRQEIPAVNSLSFGMEKRHPEPWIEYQHSPSRADIADLYARCDAWLFTSVSEGFGLPILEAMASRTPVIATPAGAAPQLVDSGNGQLVDLDLNSVVAALRFCRMSNSEWTTLSNNALRRAGKKTWDSATDKIETIFRSYQI